MQKVDPLTSQECPCDNGCAVLDHMTKSKEPNVSILVDAFLGIPWRQRRELGSLMLISDLSLKKSLEVRVQWCVPAILALRKWKQGDQEDSL